MYNNKRMLLSIFWVIVGVVLLALSIAGKLDSSLYSGMGGGLIAVGALQTVRHIRYNRDPEYKERIDTEVSDERNRFLRMKSWSWTAYIVVLVEAVGAIIAMIAGERTIQLILSYSVCLIVFVYWLTYVILSKKY